MIALLDLVPDADAVDYDLAVIFEDLSFRSNDVSIDAGINAGDNTEVPPNDGNVGNDCNDGDSDDGDLEGLCCLGRRFHQFNKIEHLFDNISAKLEWSNKDYDHNPLVDDNGEYAPYHKLSVRCQSFVTR